MSNISTAFTKRYRMDCSVPEVRRFISSSKMHSADINSRRSTFRQDADCAPIAIFAARQAPFPFNREFPRDILFRRIAVSIARSKFGRPSIRNDFTFAGEQGDTAGNDEWQFQRERRGESGPGCGSSKYLGKTKALFPVNFHSDSREREKFSGKSVSRR